MVRPGAALHKVQQLPTKKSTFSVLTNTDQGQHLPDETPASVWWPWQLIWSYLTVVNVATDTANRAQIDTTDNGSKRRQFVYMAIVA